MGMGEGRVYANLTPTLAGREMVSNKHSAQGMQKHNIYGDITSNSNSGIVRQLQWDSKTTDA